MTGVMFSKSFGVISDSMSHGILVNLSLVNYYPVHKIYILKKNKHEDSEWSMLASGAMATNYHNPGGLQNRNLWFDALKGTRLTTRDLQDWLPPRDVF